MYNVLNKKVYVKITSIYCISCNKCWASNKCCPLIKAAPLAIHIEISGSPLISAAPPNAGLIRIVTIFY